MAKPLIGNPRGRCRLQLSPLVLVELGDELIQIGQKFVWITEESVKVDLGKQQGQPLEILPADRVGRLLEALFGKEPKHPLEKHELLVKL